MNELIKDIKRESFINNHYGITTSTDEEAIILPFDCEGLHETQAQAELELKNRLEYESNQPEEDPFTNWDKARVIEVKEGVHYHWQYHFTHAENDGHHGSENYINLIYSRQNPVR